jgi:hypothetical protein
MKRLVAAIALACAAVLPAACNPDSDAPAAAETPEASARPEVAAAPAAPATPAPAMAGEPAAPGAPAFAALYPGAVLDAPAVTATSPAGPGGLATYTTDADPDAVIAFHRAHAEAAGLSSANVMEQGDARAYGATSADGDKNLQVVASATEAGPTSVQISWSAGS